MTEFNPFDVRLGATIRARREHLHITQAQLADRIGVTFQQIQKYEKGVNRIAAARLVDIAVVLDSSASELLGERAGEDRPGAAAMLRAWNAIDNDAQRQAVLQVARAMLVSAGTVLPSGQGSEGDRVTESGHRHD